MKSRLLAALASLALGPVSAAAAAVAPRGGAGGSAPVPDARAASRVPDAATADLEADEDQAEEAAPEADPGEVLALIGTHGHEPAAARPQVVDRRPRPTPGITSTASAGAAPSRTKKDEKIKTRCGTPLASVPRPQPNGDAIDLSRAAVAHGVGIASWPISSRMTQVVVGGGQMCTMHSMAGKWPLENFFGSEDTKVEGNQWIFAYLDGRWVGGAGHWLRPGQVCKGGNLSEVGPDVFYNAPPLRDWSPCKGELVGFAVSTPARAGQWGVAERSNVVLIRWP